MAAFTEKDVERLMQDKSIIRCHAKIKAAIHNAKKFLEIPDFEAYIWGFVDGRPIQNNWTDLKDVPCFSPVSDQMAKDLKKRGFQFVGTKICYSFMQAAGLVNDHIASCFIKKGS
jgi:DNA-3-methyladenine glycosylase I